jgi:type IV fimbrial biogenesis protein FimT
MRTPARLRGFTIIELMITILILGLLMALAVPSFTETIRANRLIAETNEVVGGINYARSEALKRASTVSICARSTDTACGASATTNWSSGWLIFVDANANGVFNSANDRIIQMHPAIASEYQLSSTNRGYVRFMATGVTGDGQEVFDLYRTGCTGNKARRLSLALIGRLRNDTVACP